MMLVGMIFLTLPAQAAQSDDREEQENKEVIQQSDALLESPPDQHLLSDPQPVPTQRCNGANCDRYGVSSLEIAAGVGAFAKGIAFAATETDDKSRGEAGVVLVADMLIGLFLIVDGLYRLLARG